MNGSRFNIPLLLSALLGALAESTVAFLHSMEIDSNPLAALLSFVTCFALIAAVTVPAAVALGLLVQTASARNLARMICLGFGGRDEGSVAISLIVLVPVLFSAALISVQLSLIIAAEMTLVFALVLEAVVFTLVLCALLMSAPLLGDLAAKLNLRGDNRWAAHDNLARDVIRHDLFGFRAAPRLQIRSHARCAHSGGCPRAARRC